MSFTDNVLKLEGHPLRNPFWRELEEEGTLTFRDNYQFELKSEFFLDPNVSVTQFKQEFYLFVPETLQINPQTYSAQQFYLDQLSLIRYKTPYLNFKDLIDPENTRSPLHRIQASKDKNTNLDEMMLFGNIFRTSLRLRVRKVLKKIRTLPPNELESFLDQEIPELINDARTARTAFSKTKQALTTQFNEKEFVDKLDYIDEYISIVCEEYLTLLLRVIREQHNQGKEKADVLICEFLESEESYRKNQNLHPKGDGNRESILYRQGLLEKFMLSSLKLSNTRIEVKTQYGNLIGATAAGIAMFVYMVLFVWNATTIVINSVPFVLLAVFLYILKDRIKEGMKMLYNRHINRWFSDYRTRIYTPEGAIIGRLTESFLFIPNNKLSKEILELRMRTIDDSLESFQPNELILQYKKEVKLYHTHGRLTEINTIFRYNIHRFLEKANDALQPTLRLDQESQSLDEVLLPKVYHLHLILKSSFLDRHGKRCDELKSFSIIIDKNGIKRVEHNFTNLLAHP
jgi:hypothetical protein